MPLVIIIKLFFRSSLKKNFFLLLLWYPVMNTGHAFTEIQRCIAIYTDGSELAVLPVPLVARLPEYLLGGHYREITSFQLPKQINSTHVLSLFFLLLEQEEGPEGPRVCIKDHVVVQYRLQHDTRKTQIAIYSLIFMKRSLEALDKEIGTHLGSRTHPTQLQSRRRWGLRHLVRRDLDHSTAHRRACPRRNLSKPSRRCTASHLTRKTRVNRSFAYRP